MKFLLNRNRTITSLMGHSIAFKKGELTYVPKEMYADAVAAGAIPENELEEDEKPVAKTELTADERKNAIFSAFAAIVEKNDRESFTGNGLPDAKVVSSLTGFTVSAAERATLWTEFKQKEAE